MLIFIKQTFVALLCLSTSLPWVAKVFDSKKCVSLNNGPCLSRPTLIDFNSNKPHFYQFMVRLNRCNESCNTLDELSSRICAPNEIEHKYLNKCL